MGPESGGMSAAPKTADAVRREESRVEAVRDRLGGYLAELDRRRHALMRVRSSPFVWSAIAVGTAAALAGVVLAIRSRRRTTRAPSVRAQRLMKGLKLLSEDPDRVAGAELPVWKKVVTAAGTAMATKIVAELVKRTIGNRADGNPK